MFDTLSAEHRLRMLLQEGYELTITEILQRLGIRSDRHARRLLENLRRSGLAIRHRTENRVRYYALAASQLTAHLELPTLSEQQLLALAVAAEASRPFLSSTPLEEPLREVATALLQAMGPKVFTFDAESEGTHRHFGGVPSTPIPADIFEVVLAAIRDAHRLRNSYYSAHNGRTSENRLVEPYGLAVRAGSWLMVAYCHERRALRDFALTGISHARTDGVVFDRPADFDLDAYFRSRFTALTGERTRVRLLVEPNRAPYFHRKLYHPSQHIETMRDDGRIVVTFDVDGIEDIRAWAQSWGIGVTVLDPPELVERLRREARELWERYERADGS